ncbi:Leucine-rich repeat,Leucine-rich repeat domain, L domain-like,Leucine-rich repeat, typical subtype [Cinara cedri]|uniref:Leucine-rich repeat,Leucine-rich repeat domain, L domain-like,Leucine-rich repeat, typical subtype n=1 Tax=Cinara cedri TaxID=506608 RepID=A0A5E4MFB5_9HEMI|nr:Leucine-rich repeat,Leucine-rich repeat domain, L domain-like,Leucine-rich repeat, typical subtype [Cinara cedri]
MIEFAYIANSITATTTVVAVALVLCLPAAMCEPTKCTKPELKQCYCGKTTYDRQELYAVNCTGTSLSTTRSLEALTNLPDETEVLIFTGNNLHELPCNVFGDNVNLSQKLRFVDMSNNNIKVIKGKSYHHVLAVERLILNNNNIGLDGIGFHHPRVFSNFVSLVELHLTSAFADNGVANISTDLYEVFQNSNLTRLAKLHLEHNKISSIKEPRVFCPLSNLLDLHLSNNLLTGIHFDISCMSHLRFIDLESNRIRGFHEEDLAILDSAAVRSKLNNSTFAVDLTFNPFSCGCNIEIIYNWKRNTNVIVRNGDLIVCRQDVLGNPLDPYADYHKFNCPIHTTLVDHNHEGHTMVILFVFGAVILFLGAVLYVSRFGLKRFRPEFNTSSRKIHYTTIDKCEEQEIQYV